MFLRDRVFFERLGIFWRDRECFGETGLVSEKLGTKMRAKLLRFDTNCITCTFRTINHGSVLLWFSENKAYYFWYWNFSIMHYIDQKQSEDKKNNPFKIKVFHDALVAAPPPTTYLFIYNTKTLSHWSWLPHPAVMSILKIFYENNNVLTSFKWLTRFKFERSLLFCSVLQMRFNDDIDSVSFWFLPSQKPPPLHLT